jgi:hypothetical protein
LESKRRLLEKKVKTFFALGLDLHQKALNFAAPITTGTASVTEMKGSVFHKW